MSTNSSGDEILFNFLFDFLYRECKFGKTTSTKIAAQFTDLEKFVKFNFSVFKKYRSADGNKLIRGFKDEYTTKIKKKIKFIKPEIPLVENYLQLIGRDFIRTQITNLHTLTLEKLNPNPFLITVLNLN
ncbi:unnamed protein product, partial [marine sediment metagenome]